MREKNEIFLGFFSLIVVNQIDNVVIKITTILITGFMNNILILFLLIFFITMTSKVQGITIKPSKIYLLLGHGCTCRTHDDLMSTK
jgi:hypothetical protein